MTTPTWIESDTRDDFAPFVPTPEQIAQGAAEVRKTWSRREFRRRAPYLERYRRVEIPILDARKFAEEIA